MTTNDQMQQQIDNDVKNTPVILYMKGDKDFPMCGFSARVVQILNALGAEYETRNVLEDDNLRQGIKDYSEWPTIPQLYINGEFIGGSDIAMELYQSGELRTMLDAAK
ncbi:MAG: Grx4 family monothiol glutaredoxin [Caldilineaceae bacterium]|nr:Grx4 family monothiol glutaredoxin [Caldilineaceae bacterium]MCB9137748.1 Grx4 family monothiol glutaredoxin [Caldilineaceae bacterium]